ncbi:unnamed protein product [Brachionus calyciflorus]|uniref:CWH43-like N-terminal domain-containing protein n=1 Tax=Brachionus calyciflorus TaxID=104777 RepID=A0A813UHA4_9BILA|nr:unnamed protein product [Brachionus calyciflorus]
MDLHFKHLCYFGFSLPLGAFIACIFLSMYKDFESANHTHCQVDNIFPSISACISNFFPQNTLWRLCIGIDSFPRYLIAFIYYNKYYIPKTNRMRKPTIYLYLIKLGFLFHIIELTSLLILTYVSSVEIFFIHMISFVIFLITSSFYMILTIWTYYLQRDDQSKEMSIREKYSKKLKLWTFLFYLTCFMMSLYFYIRHNTYCEPYIYSLFSLMEYLTVLANIFYHSIIIYDLNLNNNTFKISLIETKNF